MLVEFDLRRPKIYSSFGLENEHGVSSWLTGKDELRSIIKATGFEDLFVITSGPISLNPAELIALEKTNELIKLLRKKYDYIIIDTPPVGSASDIFPLLPLADACIIVVRQNLSIIDHIENTIEEIRSYSINSISMIFNDLKPDSRHSYYSMKYKNSYYKKKV